MGDSGQGSSRDRRWLREGIQAEGPPHEASSRAGSPVAKARQRWGRGSENTPGQSTGAWGCCEVRDIRSLFPCSERPRGPQAGAVGWRKRPGADSGPAMKAELQVADGDVVVRAIEGGELQGT